MGASFELQCMNALFCPHVGCRRMQVLSFNVWFAASCRHVSRRHMQVLSFNVWFAVSCRRVGRRHMQVLSFNVWIAVSLHLCRGGVQWQPAAASHPQQAQQLQQHPECCRLLHVHSAEWPCGAAMLSEWIHVGTAEAATSCQLIVIDGKCLARSLRENRIAQDIASECCHLSHVHSAEWSCEAAMWSE